MAQPALESDAEPASHGFQPFVPPEAQVRELTFRGLFLGSLLGIVFAASSVYLGLKVGLTVSASIPVAVLSITLFRWLGMRASILENNIVQTTGSAGESIAAGVAFTLPSLLLMGFELELVRILLVALLGGLIGVLMMIPLRHGLIVKEHGKLAYPEGTACADVLIVGEQGGTNAKTVFLGFFIGLGYTGLNLIAKLWSDVAVFAVDFWGKLKGATLAFEVSPPMLGVGYIIGPRVAANMMAGGALAFMVLVPLIHFFGDAYPGVLGPGAEKPISEMSPGDIRNGYVLFIGAGAVATGGFIALARAIPTIVAAFAGGLRNLKSSGAGAAVEKRSRTEHDLPMQIVIGGALLLAVGIWLAPVLEINAFAAILIVLFGFFFVTVSSRITGEIGSSSNPISGMTIATLLITCGLFVAIGWTGVEFKAMALSTAALVCVAASNGGTISQDLKTGYLVGATPRHQQVSILVGVMSSGVVIGFVLLLLNQGHTTHKGVSYPDYTASVPAEAQTQEGPDGKPYRVVYLQEVPVAAEAGQSMPTRGKYLVDEQGKLAFLVDPGVCGTYPYRVEPVLSAVALPVPNSPLTEYGTDRKPYRAVEVSVTPPGQYLVDEKGRIRYALNGTEPEEVDSKTRLPFPAQAEIRKGLDGKEYRVATLAAPIETPGRFLVDDRGIPAYETIGDKWKFDAPKAQLFRLIIDGMLGGDFPVGLVLIGVFLAILMELVGVSSLPFAVGLYLPISTSAGIFVGGIVRHLVDKKRKGSAAEAEFSPGMLMASGLIAGGAIAGVGQSVIASLELEDTLNLSWLLGGLSHNETWWPMLPFVAMAAGLYWVGTKSQRQAEGPR